MNLSDCKQILVPSVETLGSNIVHYNNYVSTIKDANNNTLYTGHRGWVTIWEGSKTITARGGDAQSTEYVCSGIFENVTSHEYRVTFTLDYNAPVGATIYYTNPSAPNTVTTTPSVSPLTVTVQNTGPHKGGRLLYISQSGKIDGPECALSISSDGYSSISNELYMNGIYFVLDGGTIASTYYCTMTITKIEQHLI